MDFNICSESGNAVLQTIHSSEGCRALKLLQKRSRMRNELEEAKNKIENKNNKNIKFGGSYADKLEEKFRAETVGLVSAEEFREKRIKLQESFHAQCDLFNKKKDKLKFKGEKVIKKKLSFEEECEDGDTKADSTDAIDSTSDLRKKKLGKDPTVNTEFLPDPERDARLEMEKNRLIKEYYENEERLKNEMLQVTYSYWDGTGHRRSARIPKDTTIRQFLEICRRDLEKDFPELRNVMTENLLYIKEDLIIPHIVTFYELIKKKVRGKSGPLFQFDVHDDVRLFNDATVEKDESHAGKVVERKWYERNKHIFPASRWELYNPNKTFEKYTIHGSKDHSKSITKL